MNLYERLPQEDIHKLWRYLEDFSGGTALPESEMDYFLRYWTIAKRPFYEAFGEQFIIKKPVCFDKPKGELEEEMEDTLLYEASEVSYFRDEYRHAIRNVFQPYTDERYQLGRFIEDYKMLVENIYDGPPITIPGSVTRDGRPLQINSNCKASRMLGKIADALGCAKYYEAFRQAHSQVLNQKTIKGNLCLSIHPLDYITMSDNASNWSSCMSWMDEPGDYRLGTIEMMNSDYVIVAYIEAKEPMSLYYSYPATDDPMSKWNNKRWRQLYIVTPDLILGNRQYPYHNDTVQGIAIKWIRELMTPIKGYGPYSQEACMIENFRNNVFGTARPYIALEMAYMYNDIYNQRMAYVNTERFATGQEYRIMLSGPAVCTACGDVIHKGDIEDASNVRCNKCNGYFYCSHCGEWSGGECYTGADGRTYCEWCFYNGLEKCECCEDRAEESDLHHVYIRLPGVEEFDQWRYHVPLCRYCYTHGCFEREYGKITYVKDDFGVERPTFDLRNIDDDTLFYGDLDSRTATLLVDIKHAESSAELIELIDKL